MDITSFIYKPHAYKTNGLDPIYCSYSVADGGRLVTFHQCTRLPKEKIEGYGFCKRHAALVTRCLDRQVNQV